MNSLVVLTLMVVFAGGQDSDSVVDIAVTTTTTTVESVDLDSASSDYFATVFGSGYSPSPEPTTLPTPPTATLPGQPNMSSTILGGSSFVGDGLCRCDLQVDQCDRLCCCDRDCSAQSQAIFNCSSTSSSQDVCITADEIVRTSLIPCSCSTASLFCVVSEQDPSNQEYGPPVTVSNAAEFVLLESIYRIPGTTPEYVYRIVEYGSVYKVGDPILMMSSDLSPASFFTVPSPFNGRLCHDGNPITYFNDMESTCERHLSVLSEFTCSLFSASSYYDNISIFQVPNSGRFGQSSRQIGVSSFFCMETEHCEFNPPTYNRSTNTCFDVALKVFYTILHDGSGRIMSVTAEITIGTVQDTLSWIQEFSVKFVESTEVTLRRSGNPGYLEGEIILAGILSDNTIKLSTDRTKWLHLKDSRSDCDMDETLPVRFLYDIETSCFMNVSVNGLVNNCFQVRQKANSALSTSTVLNYVGRFGNSNPELLTQWVQVLTETLRQSQFISSSVCTDVVTSLAITILYSYSGNLTAPNAVISGVKYTYLSQNVAPSLIQNGQLALRTSLQFIDVTSRPQHTLKSLNAPVLRLPQDFLYPFFVASTCLHLSSNFIFISVLLLLLI